MKAKRHRTRVRAALATAACWTLLTGTAVAATDTIVPTLTAPTICTNAAVCQTDNADVYYYMDSSGEYELEGWDRDMVLTMWQNEYSPTDLVRHYDDTPVFSGEGETDHIWQEGSTGLDSDAVGMAWCNDPVGTTYECDQHYIRIRGNDEYDLNVTCHEMGHAVGLVHGYMAYPKRSTTDQAALGCMVSAGYEPDLGTNNINGINSTY
ncbi:hypothetical protein PV664_34325 [Streptomyces sp. ME01-18a]|uniref:hypothetical protein n=1 Tax=Streptomyces sp. ME01-18a TaxID=3028669 RepID=UPI0029A8B08B|nr:hypothetical protein [Streptomyces sp. ME01-18a]MDX3433951.1 hypothetical protein [Streptomyces sp. ME01-18a]